MTTVRDIVKEVVKIEQAVAVLDIEYKNQKEMLEKKLKEVQSRCKHQVNKHHPDPSGNNDSWDECEICGYES